jgi:hypothetical protein
MKIDPVGLIKQAVTAVEEASVPEDLRPIAFARVLDLLASTTGAAENAGSGAQRVASSDGSGEGSDLASRIAAKISVPVTQIDRVFDERDGDLIFSGNVSALGRSKAEKVSTLALLLLAGRRWAGLDGGGSTLDKVVRAEVDSHGLLDVTNYGKHVALLKPYATITGSGMRAVYKIKYDGLERAKDVARSLAGPE